MNHTSTTAAYTEHAIDPEHSADALIAIWRTLSPTERSIIFLLVSRWAAHDARAGLELVHPDQPSA